MSNIKKINLIKVIPKLECLVYQNIYIYIISSYYILVEPFRLKQIQKVVLQKKKPAIFFFLQNVWRLSTTRDRQYRLIKLLQLFANKLIEVVFSITF
jgi:hypothetical protein